jgi:plasmid stabilization system protein ParE
MRLRYTVEARSHIKTIYDYLAERNPTAALEIMSRIRGAENCCRTFPESGMLESILERPSGS